MLRRCLTSLNASAPTVTTYHLLQYSYVNDVLERRVPLRPAHFEYAKSFAETGKLKMGGAFDPPSDGALLLFQADKAEVEEFAKNDPYVQGGLVTKVTVKPWSVVIGGDGFQA